MFGTGGAKRMLSRMFGGEDAWLFVGRSERRGASVSAGTRSEVRPRSPPQRIDFCCPQAGSRRSGLRVSCIVSLLCWRVYAVCLWI